MKTNRRCAGNGGSYEDNLRVPIHIEGNARGRALRFVLGRRRRLAAEVIPPGSRAEGYILELLAWFTANIKVHGAATSNPSPSSLCLYEQHGVLRFF